MAATPAPDTSGEDTSQPLGLNPITIGQCNVGQSHVTVADMRSAKDGLVAFKYCNSKSGYIHIRERHERG